MRKKNFAPHWDSIPGPSSPWRVAISTALSLCKKSNIEDKRDIRKYVLKTRFCAHTVTSKKCWQILFPGQTYLF